MLSMPTSASVLARIRGWLGCIDRAGGNTHTITLNASEASALVSKTQLSYLDLATFYEYANHTYGCYAFNESDAAKTIRELASKLQCVIAAIRLDGLDPRHNPERDALKGLWVTGYCGPGRYTLSIDNEGAEKLVEGLRQSGYKIVKDAS